MFPKNKQVGLLSTAKGLQIKGLTESEDDNSAAAGSSTVDENPTFRSKRSDAPSNDSQRKNVKRIKEEEVSTNELEEERLREFLNNSESFQQDQDEEQESESITDEGPSSHHQIDDPVSYFILLCYN